MMKTKIGLVCVCVALLTGCASMQDRIGYVIETAGKVGNVDYQRNGFWTSGTFTITVNEDGTRTAHYNGTTKTPLGPSVHIKVEGIPAREQ